MTISVIRVFMIPTIPKRINCPIAFLSYFFSRSNMMKYTISNFIGYIAGVVNSFFWNKLWVFKKLNSNFIREAILFLVCFGICYGIQFISLLILVEILYVPDSWAQLLSMIVYTLCNFIMNRCITFKK